MVERIYPVGIQTFSDIIKRGCVYVDKTDLIYKLTKKYKYVFLSRPRRFGKSLLSTTLHSYFAGEKTCSRGLPLRDWKRTGQNTLSCISICPHSRIAISKICNPNSITNFPNMKVSGEIIQKVKLPETDSRTWLFRQRANRQAGHHYHRRIWCAASWCAP